MKQYKVGIIGCGAILPRHLEAIEFNDNFKLVALCDIQDSLVNSLSKKHKVKGYTDYKKMITSKEVNFVVVATPNSLHMEQSMFALENGCDIIVEKPVAFTKQEVEKINQIAKQNNQNAYCVLQVRLNPTIQIVKDVINENLLGDIRGVNFIQRWQRPFEYFSGWRAEPFVGGGTLYECGIHYLDVIQHLFGTPKVVDSKVYTVKHKGQPIEDTIYSIFDWNEFGGTCEVTIAAEPQNLECSLSILGSNGYVKIGGKAFNIIESANFLSHGCRVKYDYILEKYPYSKEPNSYGSYAGSCPNHPEVYANLDKFRISESYNVIELIDNIYQACDVKYY